jgi:threonine dehydrogenase-like Zn-dependent dehydrogenase
VHSYILQDVEMLGCATTVDPVCGADDAILKIEAVSVCSTDISYYRGHLTPVSWPLIPGHEVVGTVVEVGERSDPRVSVGDRLTYWGQIDFFGLAEYRMITPLLAGVALEEQNWFVQRGFRDASHAAVAHVPSGMPANTATLAEPLTSVLRSLLSCPPKPGDLVVVLGCGPAGLLSIQVLRRLLAAGTIIAMDVDPQRLALATRYGADETAQPVDLDGAARPTDPGLGFADYVFDALPHIATSGRGSGIRTEAMDMLRAGGTYTIYGATSLPQQINTWPVLAKGLTVRAAAFDVGLFPCAAPPACWRWPSTSCTGDSSTPVPWSLRRCASTTRQTWSTPSPPTGPRGVSRHRSSSRGCHARSTRRDGHVSVHSGHQERQANVRRRTAHRSRRVPHSRPARGDRGQIGASVPLPGHHRRQPALSGRCRVRHVDALQHRTHYR